MSGSDLADGAREPTGDARESTGDQGVDEILRQLDAVDDEPLDTQLEVGERVYQALQGRLADLDRE